MRQKKLAKNLEDFKQVDQVKGGAHGHPTDIYQKIPKTTPHIKKDSLREKKLWYVKTSYNPAEPIELEIVAGELYRYWIGNTQPKTRLITDSKGNRYVASEGVFNFTSFKDLLNKQIEISDYKTLARILVCAMLVEETDLKSDNIGINQNNNIVIKIDHDSSFWEIVRKIMSMNVDHNKLEFTFTDLENILSPANYKVAAWAGGLPNEIKAKLNANPNFKKEVYLQILKVLIMPYQPVNLIIDSNVPQNINLKADITGLVSTRVNLLMQQMLLSKDFREFILSLNFQDVISEIQNDFKNFFLENRDYLHLTIKNILLNITSNKFDKTLSEEDLGKVVYGMIKKYAENVPDPIVNFLLDQVKDRLFLKTLDTIDNMDKLSEFASYLTNMLYDNAEHYFTKPDHSMLDAFEMLHANIVDMQQKDELVKRLKIDIHNPEHLKFWESKTKSALGFGGHIITLNKVKYTVPDKIAKIMELNRDPHVSYKEFKDNIDKIRLEKPEGGFSPFWDKIKAVIRDKAVLHFYTTPNIEDIILEDLQPSQELKTDY